MSNNIHYLHDLLPVELGGLASGPISGSPMDPGLKHRFVLNFQYIKHAGAIASVAFVVLDSFDGGLTENQIGSVIVVSATGSQSWIPPRLFGNSLNVLAQGEGWGVRVACAYQPLRGG